MLTYVRGNLFESPAEALVNTVNTEGVMGKGVALGFKQVFPEMFTEYREVCESGELTIGRLHVWRSPQKVVVNFPTKKEWRKPSRVEYIEAGLRTFVAHYERLGIYSVAFPPLGCGNGELSFERQVRPVMEQHLGTLDIPVYIYAPIARSEVAEHRQPRELKEWLRSRPSEMPFNEVWNDLAEKLSDNPTVRPFGKQVAYLASIDDDRTEIRVTSERGSLSIPKSSVKETWTRLRAHGIITPVMVLAENVMPLFPILALLPYIQPVRIASRADALDDDRSWGIQLGPQVDTEQRGLALRA